VGADGRLGLRRRGGVEGALAAHADNPPDVRIRRPIGAARAMSVTGVTFNAISREGQTVDSGRAPRRKERSASRLHGAA
jgi:hypothetical protein